MERRILIIAGPNGAGKTTFAGEFLPGEAGCPDFINADLLASGLSPFDPDALSLPVVELAIARVRGRVKRGGHSVPEPVIRRRFAAGLRNFHAIYKPLVDGWMLYDNAGPVPALVASGDNA